MSTAPQRTARIAAVGVLVVSVAFVILRVGTRQPSTALNAEPAAQPATVTPAQPAAPLPAARPGTPAGATARGVVESFPDVRLARLRELLRAEGRAPKALRRELFLLAASGHPDALGILREALAHGDPAIRAAAAIALSRGGYAEGAELLRGMLQDRSPEVVCAAIRALGMVDVAALRQWGLPALDGGGLPATVQGELLMALAHHGDMTAIDRALALAVDCTDHGVVELLLERAAALPADVAVPMAQAVIESSQATSDLRLLAFEALSDAETATAAGMLLHYAGARQSLAERRGAAEALATMAAADLPASALSAAIVAQPDAQTRAELYRAMVTLAAPDPRVLLPAIQGETDPSSQVAALFAAGTLCGMDKADAAMRSYFDTIGTQALEDAAGSATLPAEVRIQAVSALRNAGTPAARSVLDRLTNHADPVIRQAASRPLPTGSRN